MQVTAGPSGRDWTSFTGSKLDDVAALSLPAKSLRIGVLAPSRWSDSCPEVRAGMDLVLGLLDRSGFAIAEVDFDVAAASAVGAIFYRVGCAAAIRSIPPAQRHRLDKDLIEFADGRDATPLTDYLEACRQRDEHANRLTMLFESIDLLLLPTMPLLPFEAGRLVPLGWPSNDWMSWNPYTPAFNIAQVPALSYPVWPDGSALPVGVQLVAPRHCDDRLLALGAWLEQHLPVRLAPLAGATL
jgi:aspartyl-tRNA(Asn)/glutamyl-tRNA(Gln) amidotransferase subunit A